MYLKFFLLYIGKKEDMKLDEGLFLSESVKNINGIYFTHSYIDLGLLLRKNNIGGKLVRTVGFPEQ